MRVEGIDGLRPTARGEWRIAPGGRNRSARPAGGRFYLRCRTVQDWLLDSDPALRWQVLRDLSDAPPSPP